MPNVLLLREPTVNFTTPNVDRYEAAFRSAGYTPLSIPVLETVHVNIPELRDVIVRGPRDNNTVGSRSNVDVDGVIVTSKRSCEAWGEALSFALRGLDSGYRSSSDANTNAGENAAVDASYTGVAQWSQIPFYVVGPTTSLTLQSTFTSLHLPIPPIRGENSGSAAALAPLILQDIRDQGHSRANADASPRLLYLTGDKNRDTLPQVLGEGGVELEEVQVYVTQGSVAFEGRLEAALASPSFSSSSAGSSPAGPPLRPPHSEAPSSPSSTTGDTTPSSNTWWIIYFAPSAASFVTPILQKHFVLPASSSSSSSSSITPNPPSPSITPQPQILRQAQIASIGPTTHAFLTQELQLKVHATAGKPTPEDIVRVIQKYDADSEIRFRFGFGF